MASSSSSSSFSSSQVKSLHVFPSFHGPDVRKGFLSHLHDLFARKEITIFKDQEIERGQTIGSELVKAIREARLSIVLLSKNYASSSWCLDELVEILKCREVQGQIVMPIFYDVDPSHVRKQRGDFGIAFEKTCEGETEEVKQRWVEALTCVATIAGEHSRNWTDEAEMVEKLSTDVSNKLRMEEIKKFFREADVDQNGFITAAELRYVLTKDGKEFTDEKVRHLIRVADVDGDGQINYDEFAKFMAMEADEEAAMVRKFATDVTLSREEEKAIKELFTGLDVDQNGFITAAEFQYVMKNSGSKLTDKEIRNFFRRADVDGDGHLNYDEFVKVKMAERRRADEEAARVEKTATDVLNKVNKFVKFMVKAFILKKKE
ncbi:protein PHLOEM PROTEIN 2-LIKE A8 isoform X3 [Eutrema salsugineum]|uniref:protein PHLOEM PROTEIN 2-LIKE A8 isoform X3 n=1 Tax=Eutrema salsugineum TaxID=72664 RepID=UPI000CED3BA6|nr:protein PHLOEM PROTEIN 2-LIKE A8 isoform X3 [Eutrema salsugineum]